MSCWVLLACVLLTSSASAAEPTKLRATVLVPVTEPFMGASLGRFKEEVERETGGSLVVEIFDRGKPYPDDQVIGAIQSGALEMGVVGLNQFAKTMVPAALMEQPFLFNFEGLVRAATGPDSELRRQLDDAIFKAMGLRVLWWQTIGTMVVYTKDGDVKDPIRIKDKKMRTFSETSARFARQCGAIPVDASAGQVNGFLADGTLDMAMMTVAAIQARELWKVTTAVTRTDHVAFEFLVVISDRAWQSLSETHKTIVAQVARRVEHGVRERASVLDKAAFEFGRSKGMKIYELSPREVEEWRACSAGLLVDYMENGGGLSQALMHAYGKLRMDPCCNAGPQGDDETGKGTSRMP